MIPNQDKKGPLGAFSFFFFNFFSKFKKKKFDSNERKRNALQNHRIGEGHPRIFVAICSNNIAGASYRGKTYPKNRLRVPPRVFLSTFVLLSAWSTDIWNHPRFTPAPKRSTPHPPHSLYALLRPDTKYVRTVEWEEVYSKSKSEGNQNAEERRMKILRKEKERALKVYLPDLQSVRPQNRNRNFFSGKKSVNFFIFFQFLFFYSRFSSFKDVCGTAVVW